MDFQYCHTVKSIRELCKKNSIAISQLEGDLNFGAGLISRWTKNSPSLDKIVDIANYFHVSLDEVVGYKLNINDTFLNILYEQTSNNSIKWELGTKMVQQGLLVKLFDKREDPETFYQITNDQVQTIYGTRFKKGYILLYSMHIYDRILYPEELILFIQPSDDSFLVDQHYTKEELAGLWVKILNSLGDEAPDAVKAEDIKNEFILNQSLTNSTNKSSGKDNIDNIKTIVNDPAVQQFMELYNKPEFQKMQQVMSSPGFQTAVEVANKIQKNLNWSKK